MKTAVVLFATIIVLAGCASDDPPAPTPTPSPTPDPGPGPAPIPPVAQPLPTHIDLLLAFDIGPCDGVRITAPAPLADVQTLLPEGYQASPYELDPVGAIPVPGLEQGILIADFYRCEQLTTALSRVADTWFGHVAIVVEDPGHGLVADRHEYLFEMLAGEDILNDLWLAAGFVTFNGTAALDETATPEAPVGLGTRTMTAGPFSLTATGTSLTADSPGPTSFARYTQRAEGGRTEWTGTEDLSAVLGGLGAIDPASDSILNGFASPDGDVHGTAQIIDGGVFAAQDLRLALESIG